MAFGPLETSAGLPGPSSSGCEWDFLAAVKLQPILWTVGLYQGLKQDSICAQVLSTGLSTGFHVGTLFLQLNLNN